jgi:tetratricopeptide (TPR) repeat protein
MPNQIHALLVTDVVDSTKLGAAALKVANLAPPIRAALAQLLGQALLRSGRGTEALAHLEQALAIHREVGNRASEGVVLGGLGSLHREQGRMEEARTAFDAGEARLRAVKDAGQLGGLLCGRARLEHAEGQAEAAQAGLEEAEALAVQLGAGEESELGREIAETRAALETPPAEAPAD